jgi:hypothetical protein
MALNYVQDPIAIGLCNTVGNSIHRAVLEILQLDVRQTFITGLCILLGESEVGDGRLLQ